MDLLHYLVNVKRVGLRRPPSPLANGVFAENASPHVRARGHARLHALPAANHLRALQALAHGRHGANRERGRCARSWEHDG